ncbi:unnamed protein product [Oncorhynchus mykiss]|uniref:ZP domain-containing protein n=1 Tax=Oncorhynchus mykiss TaxID=8022 RepID=A0A060WMV7_ONCMY|nr:unnamed protein product [Oncorhynchus mykiss]
MSWMSFLCLATAFLDLCRGHNTLFEGYDLSMSSYHLCTRHESTVVSKVLSYKISYTVRRSCGDWLPWKMCEVTVYKKAYRTEYMNVIKDVLRCCDGYEQVGSYCALISKKCKKCSSVLWACPNTIRTSRHGDLYSLYSTVTENYIVNILHSGIRSWCFHVTVTAKIDYQRLISMDGGILNHTRLLHSVVTGALDSYDVSVYYIRSWPIWPFRTSSSLLISSPEILSLSNTTTKLHLLLIHIEEVTSVSVEATTTNRSMMLSSTHIHATTHNPVNASSNRSETSTAVTPLSTVLTSSRPEISTALTSWSNPAPITNLQASSVTGSSFCVSWMTGQSQSGFSFLVVLMEGSKVRGRWETGLSVWEVPLLKPGVLHNVTVISCPYGSQGASLLVKTAAQTLGATAHLTNVQFTDALLDPASQMYQNLSRSIMEEQYKAISVECRASAITVTVARDFLWSGHIGDSSLFLGTQECGVNGGNSSHVQLTVAWDECNTQLLYNSTHYTAQVILYNSMSSQLLPDDTTRVPTVWLKVPIMCTFRRSIIISSGYSTAGYDMINDAVMGSGTFYVTFQLLNGMSPLPQNYSLSPEEDVVVEVSVDSTVGWLHGRVNLVALKIEKDGRSLVICVNNSKVTFYCPAMQFV